MRGPLFQLPYPSLIRIRYPFIALFISVCGGHGFKICDKESSLRTIYIIFILPSQSVFDCLFIYSTAKETLKRVTFKLIENQIC